MPLVIMLIAASFLIGRSERGQSTRGFASLSLLLSVVTYFVLNTLYFDGAWPWLEWTSRTPNQIFYMPCAAVLAGWSLRGLARDRWDKASA